jgi:hypothetical protein
LKAGKTWPRCFAPHRRRNRPCALNIQCKDKNILWYLIHEILRVDNIFDPEGIQSELETYTPLLPDDAHWSDHGNYPATIEINAASLAALAGNLD